MSMPSDGFSPWFKGRFSDGNSAATMLADVRLGARGIEIMLPGVPETTLWPYGALRTSTPISSNSVDVLVSYKYRPGATLFVSDGAFTRLLGAEASHLTTRAQRWSQATPLLWTTAAIALLFAGAWLMDLSPARAVAGLLPEYARDALGDQVIASMTRGRRVCNDPQGKAALDKLAARLSKAAGDGAKFEVIVSDWSLLNAFAAPGEKIVLTRGLITKAESPDEVAGVLAHEMGHGVERHPETGMVRAIGIAAAVDLMLGGSGGTLANIGVALAQLSYTREAERQADAQALRMLEGAKISARGLADFFRRVQAIEGTSGSKTTGAFDILRTHPATVERLRYVESHPDYPATPSLSDKEWKALQGICGVAVEPPKAPN